MARAISYLPVPDSPVIITEASVGATSCTCRSVFWIAAEWPPQDGESDADWTRRIAATLAEAPPERF